MCFPSPSWLNTPSNARGTIANSGPPEELVEDSVPSRSQRGLLISSLVRIREVDAKTEGNEWWGSHLAPGLQHPLRP
ncbi:hypothetical protein Bca4012_036984 [Brassica carinata]